MILKLENRSKELDRSAVTMYLPSLAYTQVMSFELTEHGQSIAWHRLNLPFKENLIN